MKLIRDIIIRSIVVYAMMIIWQLIKSLIIGNVNPSLIGVILSVIVGLVLSNKIIRKLDGK